MLILWKDRKNKKTKLCYFNENSKIVEIEEILSDLLIKLGNDDYLELLKSNKNLALYDKILSRIDNGDYPNDYLSMISDEMLDDILKYLNDRNKKDNILE